METNETFRECALRHWEDGVLLEREKRLPNANQLFGVAAECAIKSALCTRAEFIPDGHLEKDHRVHVDQLWKHINESWGETRLRALQKAFPALVAVLKQENPFHDWSIAQRYAPEDAVSSDAYQRHRKATQLVMSKVGILGKRRGS